MGFKEKREPTKLTQGEAAKLLGIGRTTVSMWETGGARPRADMLPRVAHLYNCTIEGLPKKVENPKCPARQIRGNFTHEIP